MCVRTFVICSFGRFFSRAADATTALHMMRSVFTKWWDVSCFVDGRMLGLGLDYPNWILLILAIILLFAVDLLHERGIRIREGIAGQHIIFRWVVFYAALFIILIFGVWGPEYDSAGFIYEQF